MLAGDHPFVVNLAVAKGRAQPASARSLTAAVSAAMTRANRRSRMLAGNYAQ
jgi:hypothetical protein